MQPGNANELAFLDQLNTSEVVDVKPEVGSKHESAASENGGPSSSAHPHQEPGAILQALKKGNADELAFLDELAGVSPTDAVKREDDAPGPTATGTSAQPEQEHSAVLQALKKGNADELAFLNDLAGVSSTDAAKPEDNAPGAAPGPAPQQADVPASHGPSDGEIASAPGTSAAAGDAAKLEEVKPEEAKEEDETYEMDATELLDAFKHGDEAAQAQDDEDLFKDFLNELRSVDRDNEVNRILWAFKLNPFEKMNLPFTATESDVRKQYRKISLLIHPDKCSHPQAAAAFEVLQQAQKQLLHEEVRTSLLRVLEFAREKVREERRKATKHDSALRLATYLHGKGREGVEEDWEKTDDFHEKWKLASRDVLAKAEFRKRKLTQRIAEEEERLTIEEKEDAKERKKARKEKKQWLDKRTDRIDSWRDWNNNKAAKKTGGIKAPKIKTADADRSYVQRATTEQFVGNYKKKAPK